MHKSNYEKLNLSLLTDFPELSMSNAFFKDGFENTVAHFDLYFRNIPDNGGFVIMSGLQQVIEFLENLKFSDDDIEYLRSQNLDEGFLKYLKEFKFKCDVRAVPEGTPVFKNEPILTVRGPIIQAQIIETMLIQIISHQSLIATKANRIVRACEGREVIEMGSRRAHGAHSALYGAKSAFIAGCNSTCCTMAGKEFSIPLFSMMEHSWVQLYKTELEAFNAYAKAYPNNCVLAVDTYNVLKSGVPNAIKCFDETLKPLGARPLAIRIDSGDITYLSKKTRKMLDEGGYPDCQIMASNSLDEHLIRDMITQGAKVDMYGVGERLLTSMSSPILDVVYKLVAIEDKGEKIPKIKISENVTKITNPGVKNVWRLFDRENGKAIADVLSFDNETIDESKPFELFDPEYTWKRKMVENFVARPLLKDIFIQGKCVYRDLSLYEIREYCNHQIDTLWEEVLRFEYPHKYYVDLSPALWKQKQKLLDELSMRPRAIE